MFKVELLDANHFVPQLCCLSCNNWVLLQYTQVHSLLQQATSGDTRSHCPITSGRCSFVYSSHQPCAHSGHASVAKFTAEILWKRNLSSPFQFSHFSFSSKLLQSGSHPQQHTENVRKILVNSPGTFSLVSVFNMFCSLSSWFWFVQSYWKLIIFKCTFIFIS